MRRPITVAAAAAAKLLQLCLTLCSPIDSSPPGSAVPGILQARTLEWVAISFSNAWEWKVKVKSLSHVWLFATPWTAAYQAAPSMGFSRQEHWRGLPLPSPVLWLEGGKYFMLRGKDKIWQKHGEWVLKTFCCFQLLSCVLLFATPWTATRQVFLSSTVCWSLLTFMSIESWWYLSQPLPSPSLFALNVFQHQVLF